MKAPWMMIAGLSTLLTLGVMPAMADSKDGDCCEKGSKAECCKKDAKAKAECSEKGGMCSKCKERCQKALDYCLKKGGKHAEAAHINTLKDCIDSCDFNSKMIARKSSMQAKTAELCAEICSRCAKSCEALNDPALKDCVAMCNDCAKHCAGESNPPTAKK